MKLKRISAVVIAMAVIFSFMSFSAFAETNLIDLLAGETVSGLPTELSGAGTEADPYLINDVYDLIFFANTVNTYQSNGSNQFTGKYILLTADIDLGAYNWHPIGTAPDHASFNGVFDGGNHTISNLTCIGNSDYLGFFARVGNFDEVGNPTVKNVKFNNVTIQTTGSYVGGVIANSGGNSTVSNVHITGNVCIEGYAYIGGIIGHGYPKVDNCSVDATGTINSNYWACGGIVGYGGEGNGATSIKNSSVSGIEIYARSGGAAAILGVGISGAYGENISAENVTISSNSDYCMGYVFGNGEEGTLKNVTVNNVTATANGNPITSTDCIATIGNDYYPSLQAAVNAVAEGETILLAKDVTVSAGSNGVNVTEAVNFTLDLNGKTFTANTTNAAIRLNTSTSSVAVPATVKITNGTVVAGSSAYCALIAVGNSENAKLTVNTENVTFKGSNSDGSVVKIFANAIVNMNNGTVVDGSDSYGGVQCMGKVNVYDGVEIYQRGTTSYCGMILGTCNDGIADIYGGKGVSETGGLIAMTSGGTINVYGGEWIANANGQATTQNAHVLTAQNNKIEFPNGGDSVINVYGGSFDGGISAWGMSASSPAELSIAGGTFTTDPAGYLADGYAVSENREGKFAVVSASELPEALEVKFVKTTEKGIYDIIVEADGLINELSTVALTFVNESENNDGTDMGYSITGIAPYNYLVEGDKYTFYATSGAAMTDDTLFVKVGQVKFAGYGEIDFEVLATADNRAIIKTAKDNAEYIYAKLGTLDAVGELVIDTDAVINEEITPEMADLTIEVDYVHNVENNAAAYQKMTIEITGLDLLDGPIYYYLGDDGVYAPCDKFTSESNVAHTKHTVVVSDKLIVGNSYTVKVYGDGYRTAEYTIRMENDKTLKFWNNVMTNKTYMEEDDTEGTQVNFLAGDILPDEIINVYDLSAVVSYFGENPKANASYIQYDLNRDGKIDGLDISILLNSWGK